MATIYIWHPQFAGQVPISVQLVSVVVGKELWHSLLIDQRSSAPTDSATLRKLSGMLLRSEVVYSPKWSDVEECSIISVLQCILVGNVFLGSKTVDYYQQLGLVAWNSKSERLECLFCLDIAHMHCLNRSLRRCT